MLAGSNINRLRSAMNDHKITMVETHENGIDHKIKFDSQKWAIVKRKVMGFDSHIRTNNITTTTKQNIPKKITRLLYYRCNVLLLAHNFNYLNSLTLSMVHLWWVFLRMLSIHFQHTVWIHTIWHANRTRIRTMQRDLFEISYVHLFVSVEIRTW